MIKKVVVIKNIPSNIIDEATFILKDGINIEEDITQNFFKTGSVISEAESIIQEYVNKYEVVEIKKENLFEKIIKLIRRV